ncbi:MAG TPA: hypothetical protein VJT73_14660 [Polyangiaceae bacterium]|nr:hypothetical protein [Polyangiaceae bacterium]
MGTFAFDVTSEPGIIRMVLKGTFGVTEMRKFVVAHNRAVDSMGQQPYRVWVDIRELLPISPECTEIMEEAKRYSAARPNFRGSAVFVASATVALQHRRTSVSGGVMGSELISNDEAELREHLATVNRFT